jgi:hypothetical protein
MPVTWLGGEARKTETLNNLLLTTENTGPGSPAGRSTVLGKPDYLPVICHGRRRLDNRAPAARRFESGFKFKFSVTSWPRRPNPSPGPSPAESESGLRLPVGRCAPPAAAQPQLAGGGGSYER